MENILKNLELVKNRESLAKRFQENQKSLEEYVKALAHPKYNDDYSAHDRENDDNVIHSELVNHYTGITLCIRCGKIIETCGLCESPFYQDDSEEGQVIYMCFSCRWRK